MKPGKRLCHMFLLAFLALTVHKLQRTDRSVPVKMFSCNVNAKTKDCARSRRFQHKLQRHCFHGKVS